MKYGVITTIITAIICATAGSVVAGPPVDMWQPGELWLAAEYGSSHRPVPGDDNFGNQGTTLSSRSNRVILKAGYQVYPFLDLFVLGGLADLKIASGDPTFNDHASNMKLAYGGGVRVGYTYPDWNLGSSLTATVIGFSSDGEVENQYRRVVNDYHWYEIQLELVASYPLRSLTPFLGIEKTFLTGTHEVEDYFLGRLQPRPDDSDAYSDPDQTYRPLAGIAVHLPGGYATYIKASGLASNDIMVTIGICQGSKSPGK
jgi:hypothetical protein